MIKYKGMIVIFLVILIIMSFSISVFAVASSSAEAYSMLPEPVSNNITKIFILSPTSWTDNDTSTGRPTMFVFNCDLENNQTYHVYWSVSSEGKWQYTVSLPTSSSYSDPILYMYDAITGDYLGGNLSIQIGHTYTTSRLISNWKYYMNYGCTLDLDQTYDIDIAHIYWGYKVTEDWFYTIVQISLNQILPKLNEIHYQDASFYQSCRTYLNTISTRLNTTNSHLSNIKNLVQQIYDILGGGQEVTTVPPENNSFIDEYNSIENSVMTDYHQDAVEVFSYANNINSFGNAFQFLSASLQQIILNNAKLNTLVLFTLGIGIAVLIIGRKINT